MSDTYEIIVEYNPTFDNWGARVYYEMNSITPNWLTADTKEEAKTRAEERAASHARRLASRETYTFTPTV